ncbi:MAG: acyl-CoA dehydrogenase family protein [Deltaproteobacteria bacterium]|nr:acyl-CoA dehydrogenase family protein [Deltaproteobacteria bacterium]MBW2444455.1 acyl-CoA dehydrogenase family protein [Deltaproteobacteria bacterium]
MSNDRNPAALERVRAIAGLVEAGAEQAEAERTLPEKTVAAMKEAGVFRLFQPREVGGEEADFTTQILVAEELSRADGSTGWNSIANGPSGGFAAAYLGDEAIEQLFGDGKERCFGGQFAPNGQGEAVDGGFRVTGNWHFGSGIGHSEFVMGGFMPLFDGQPKILETGLPDMRVACIPREEITITDGWNVMGLCGTGSYDYECQDVFVREAFTYPLFTKDAQRGGAMYRLGIMPTVCAGHAAWALGVGRRALDEVNALARGHTRMGMDATLANRPTFQKDYIRAENRLRAARLLVLDIYAEVLEVAESGRDLTLEERARMRSAATYATEAAKDAVDFAHLGAGTAAVRNGNVIERCFRDMHTGTQHAFINEDTYLQSSEVLLGQREDSVLL